VFSLQGCLEDIEKWFKEDTAILIGLGIGVAFFHVSKCSFRTTFAISFRCFVSFLRDVMFGIPIWKRLAVYRTEYGEVYCANAVCLCMHHWP